MKHFCYMTTMKSEKATYLYFGKHSTSNLSDGYIGSGKFVTDLISSPKYGEYEITSEPICFFETSDLALEFEELLIEAAMSLPNCVNMKAGGIGGFAPPTEKSKRASSKRFKTLWSNPEYKAKVSERIKDSWTDEHKAKMSAIHKERNKDPELLKKKSENGKERFKINNYSKNASNPMYIKYDELYLLWVENGMPSYATFQKVCAKHGYNYSVNNCRPIVRRFRNEVKK